jgi:putative transposase
VATGKRDAIDYLVSEEALPITRACAHLGLARSSYYERPASKAMADAPVIYLLNQIVAKYGRWGFRLCFDWMRNQGYERNHKHVRHIYKEMD